jgi:uncharacterized protein YqfB (UPF0267 family)
MFESKKGMYKRMNSNIAKDHEETKGRDSVISLTHNGQRTVRIFGLENDNLFCYLNAVL